MASFGRLVLTSAGLQAQAMAQGGTALKFSKIKMGDGTVTGNIAALTDLKSAKVTLNITDGELKNSSYTVAAFFSNEDLTEGFYWKEIGLFIEDASGKDVLYAYANAGSNYDFIPATEDEAYAKWIRVAVAVGNATNISIADYDGIIYLDSLTFDRYKAEAEEIRIKGGRAVTGNSYIGKASDNGIDILSVKGKSVQDGTPTPDAPVEIQSFGDGTNIHSGTCQLFDASKLATKTAGEATVTNNGDGSFTISGSGEMTSIFSMQYVLSHKEFVKMFKPGTLTMDCGAVSRPALFMQVTRVINGENVWVIDWNNASQSKGTFEITQEMLDDPTSTVRFSVYAGTGNNVIPATIKPMLYQYGDGEWCEFNYADTVINQPLRSLPNGVCDTYENGKIVRRVGVKVYDETLAGNFMLSESFGDGYSRFSVTNSAYKPIGSGINVISDKFKVDRYTNTWNIHDTLMLHGDAPFRFIVSDSLTGGTLEGFRTWLASNPITVIYELATPVIEEVELPTIPSWYDWTNVWHDGVETDITWLVKNAGSGGGSVVKQLTGVTIPASGWVDETETREAWTYRIEDARIPAMHSATVLFVKTDKTEDMASSYVRATNAGGWNYTECEQGYVDIFSDSQPDSDLLCNIHLTEVKEV